MTMLKALCAIAVLLAAPALATGQGNDSPAGGKRVVEEIIVRVNNEIITSSELTRAKQALLRELTEECEGCTQEQVHAKFIEREKDVLRDLIDNALLVQRAKEVGTINVEPDVVRRLDAIRQQNNFPDMETLEREVVRAGWVWEDFKNNIRNALLSERIIQREVGREMNFTREEVQKFYDENKEKFNRPETVVLEEIFVSTANRSEEEIPGLEQRAGLLLERVRRGEDFNELAKRYSDGSTAKDGGQLGVFQRGQLAPELEDVVFAMRRGEVTSVMPTRSGYLILRVAERFDQGLQPLEKVENEIANALYMQKLQPALRRYLTWLREEGYVMVRPGHVDTAGVSIQPIVEVQPKAEEEKDSKKKKKKSPSE